MLPKQERLSLAREIRGIARAKQYSGKGPLLYLAAGDNSFKFSRLAVVVPKTLGNAVRRNRLRRVFASVFVALRPKISRYVDIVVYPRRAAIGKPRDEVLGDFMAILKDCRIIYCNV